MSHVSEVEHIHASHVNAHSLFEVSFLFHTVHVNHYADQLLLKPASWKSCENFQRTHTHSCQLLTTPTNFHARLTMDDNDVPSTPGNEAPGFTANETKLICAVMQNLTSEIQVSFLHKQRGSFPKQPFLELRITNL